MGDAGSMQMRSFVLLSLAAAAAAAPQVVQPLFTRGHAAYTYGPLHCVASPCSVVPSCNSAHWKTDIEAFNADTAGTGAEIKTVYSYGGDVEFWPKKGGDTKTACWAPAKDTCNFTSYYDPVNRKAAATYSTTKGVEQIVSLIDSRLDGWEMIKLYNNHDACEFGDFYPNLNNLTDPQLGQLAQQTAKLFCDDENVGGVQIDLEPYQDPYKEKLETFLTAISKEMKDDTGANGCKNARHPKCRTTSYFTFAHRTRDDFYKTVFNENSYFVFSGYDLRPKSDSFEYNNVTEFGNNLEWEINGGGPEVPQRKFNIRTATKSGAKFTLALPIAASCHEYEHYVPMHGDGCGPACQPWDSGVKMADYVQKMMDVLTSPKNSDVIHFKNPQFLGLSFWVWTYDMTYPPMKWFNNLFLPNTPSKDVLSILKKELPKLGNPSDYKYEY